MSYWIDMPERGGSAVCQSPGSYVRRGRQVRHKTPLVDGKVEVGVAQSMQGNVPVEDQRPDLDGRRKIWKDRNVFDLPGRISFPHKAGHLMRLAELLDQAAESIIDLGECIMRPPVRSMQMIKFTHRIMSPLKGSFEGDVAGRAPVRHGPHQKIRQVWNGGQMKCFRRATPQDLSNSIGNGGIAT